MNDKEMNPELHDQIDELISKIGQNQLLSSLIQPKDLEQFLQNGLSKLLIRAVEQERQLYLADHPEDRANGFAPTRSLQIGTTPVELERPHTRGPFYPGFLPKYQRCLPETYQQLLQDILLQAKSFRAAMRTMQALGLSYSPKQLEVLLEELCQEAKTFFQRPLAPDWFCLYIDAKVVHLKDEAGQIKKAVHFLAIGVSTSGHKEPLAAAAFWGNEVLEAWRKVLIDLKNRGLVRALMIITDDFSGLAPMIKSLFPQTDHQLCCVHLFRNAYRHLNQKDYERFRQEWQQIYACSSYEVARQIFQELLESLRPNYSAYVAYLENRTDRLYETKWSCPNPRFKQFIQPMSMLFRQRFELELKPDYFLTQNL
jgi:transposase-like protein